MIGKILKKIVGTQNERMIKKVQGSVDQVNALEEQFSKLTDDEIKAKTEEFRSRLAKGETLDDLMPEAFATVREVGKRVLNMRHYDVQLIGGAVLHSGKIAEMVTGEGKTLVATLPTYLNALSGKGVHIVTVNDYLARRDREWMGPLYEFLGLSVGVIQHDMEPEERQEAYACDITFGTNNEFGFDYLRDNMVVDKSQCVQRELNYAVVDEVDSILIDEARTPLIISGPVEESTEKYYNIEKFVRNLSGRLITEQEIIDAKNKGVDYEEGYDFLADEKRKSVWFTEKGEQKFEKFFNISVDDENYVNMKHVRDQAVKAKVHFKKDVDYVIKEGKVVIVDEFTGRLMPGRRFSDGLHQALEAKEGIKIERENQTLATITFQNYFRMYNKLSGMTGTALTEAVEFEKIYKLSVVAIPTNKEMARKNYPDLIYKTEREKFNAVLQDISKRHKKGQPVLVGTVSIEKSEYLSSLLTKHGLPHAVLNAKFHEKEGDMVSQAGQPGAITISTNMAGRGTDIVLGEGVKELGGLCVIGTERHESRRIDNQLRGRSGRQGDPGESQFYLSLQDDLMRIFGSDRISNMMDRLGMEEGQEIQHPLVSRAIETAQKRVENMNFEIRKHLLEYDDVMNRQREIIYGERNKILRSDNLTDHFFEMLEDYLESMVLNYLNPDIARADQDEEGLFEALKHLFGVDFEDLRPENLDIELFYEDVLERAKEVFFKKEKMIGKETIHYFLRSMMLHVMDSKWKEHLHQLDYLREGIGLRAYGQRDPLVEYKREAFDLFDQMSANVKSEIVELVFKVEIKARPRMKQVFDTDKQEAIHEKIQSPAKSVAAQKQPSPQSSPMQQTLPQNKPLSQPVTSQEKVGRNDPCPCGSGKKYKKCCGFE